MGLIEETDTFMPDWDKIASISKDNRVIPVAVQNYDTKEVILVAYVDEEALKESIRLKKAVFHSTSRNKIWFKGAESGNTFTLLHIFVNCEQNSLVYQVRPDKGNICHTSRDGVPNNCFYRELDTKTMKLVDINERNTENERT